jgi:hypothetical protein
MSNTIIDAPEKISSGPIYLRKSARISRIYLALLVLSFVFSSLAKITHQFSDVLTILLGSAMLALFGLSPWGLYYTWKSKKNSEGYSRKRVTYAIVHWFVFVLLILVVIRFIMDVAVILRK